MVLAHLAGTHVIATDLPHVMPNLRACLKINGFAESACDEAVLAELGDLGAPSADTV